MTDDLTVQVREALDAPCGCVHQNRTALNDGSDVPTPLRLRECSRCCPTQIAACMRAVMEKTATMNWPVLRCTIGTVGYDAEQECLAAGLAKLRGTP